MSILGMMWWIIKALIALALVYYGFIALLVIVSLLPFL